MAAEHVWGSVGGLAVGSGRWRNEGLQGRSMGNLLVESRLETELGLQVGGVIKSELGPGGGRQVV